MSVMSRYNILDHGPGGATNVRDHGDIFWGYPGPEHVLAMEKFPFLCTGLGENIVLK